MAVLELRPLKLGIKGLSHQSRLERRLRARVKTNTALCPLVIWMKSGTWEVSLCGSSICCGSVEGHISSSLQNCKWKIRLAAAPSGACRRGSWRVTLSLLDKKTGLPHFLEYQKAQLSMPSGGESINRWGDSRTAPYRFSCECPACPPDWRAAAASWRDSGSTVGTRQTDITVNNPHPQRGPRAESSTRSPASLDRTESRRESVMREKDEEAWRKKERTMCYLENKNPAVAVVLLMRNALWRQNVTVIMEQSKENSTFTFREEDRTVLTQNMSQVRRHRPEMSRSSGQRATNDWIHLLVAWRATLMMLIFHPFWKDACSFSFASDRRYFIIFWR